MSGWTIRPRAPGDREAWEALVAGSADAWIGHTWWWNEAVEEGVWRGVGRSLVVEHDDRLVGILPLHEHSRKMGPLVRRILHSNYWMPAGPAILDDLDDRERPTALERLGHGMRAVARFARADKSLVAAPVVSPRGRRRRQGERWELAAWAIEELPASTRVLRLAGRTEDDLWMALEGRARTAVRKAEREGVTVVAADDRRAGERYYPLHLATYERTATAPLPRAYFETVLDSPHFTVFFAQLAGHDIGATIVSHFKGGVVYASSASLDAAHRTGANNLLQWHAIRWAARRGCEIYELGTVEHPADPPKTRQVARFKASFGGEIVSTTRGQVVYSRGRERAIRFLHAVRGTRSR